MPNLLLLPWCVCRNPFRLRPMSRPLLKVAHAHMCCLSAKRSVGRTAVRCFATERSVNVVLLQDLGVRGFVGDEVTVKPGFARNFLIPTKKAVYATQTNRDRHLMHRTEEDRKRLEARRDYLLLKERIKTRVVTCVKAVGLDERTIEQPLTAAELVKLFQKQLKFSTVTEDRIHMPRGGVLKMLGEAVVQVRVDVPELVRGQDGKPTEMVDVKVEVLKGETRKAVKRVAGEEGGGNQEAAAAH